MEMAERIIASRDRLAYPKISVVMSVYNGERYLRRAVDSILKQTFKDFEFIIINDGSTDSSLDILKRYGDRDRRIVIVDQENIGLTKSLNRGIRVARGEFIARQDADDVSSLNRFDKQMWYIDRGYNFVCCRHRINGRKISPKLLSIFFYKVLIKYKNVFIHGTFLFRKKILDKTGYYNEDFVYAQDYEFVRRLIKHKVKIRYMRDILYYSTKDSNVISISKLPLQQKYMKMAQKYSL